MWIARIARPGAIYDASAASHTFSTGELVGFLGEENSLSENEEKEPISEEEEDFDHIPGFADFKNKKQQANKVNISKKNKKLTLRKRILRCGTLFFCKSLFGN